MSYPAGAPLRHVPPWRIESRRVAQPESPFELFGGLLFGLVALQTVVRHAEQVGGLLAEAAAPLKWVLGD